ncbi:MAG: EAL domain-containing protein [Pseudomonadota bacterium]
MSSEILLEPGDVLYREGDENDFGYILESGEISLFTETDGRRVETERRGPGSILGELSILTGKPRAVTVEALEPCRLFKIPAQQILRRFGALDPVLKACVETSIQFSAKHVERLTNPDTNVELAPTTLGNAKALIDLFELDRDMSVGLQQGEFFMVYQPIVALTDGRIKGFEALMRWRHPTRGDIPPDHFIAVAEEMETIDKVTDFALIETCRTLGRLQHIHDGDEPLFASVNISGQDIGRNDLIDFIAYVLELNEVPPENLKLEVTETALVPDNLQAAQNLEQLQALGCGVSIDDFGTGYSNLGYLKALPLSAIKIDRSFAGDASANPVSHSIVKMLVRLGQELGVDVIAEGLETQEDADTLREIGCSLAQGYHFARPMTDETLVDLLRTAMAARSRVA